MRLFDEIMVGVMAGEVSPLLTGLVYCAVISACNATFDLRRAQEWTTALTRWCESQSGLVAYRGVCLVHRAEILQLRGAWPSAVDEAQQACERLSQPPGHASVGSAQYMRGELHRLRHLGRQIPAPIRVFSFRAFYHEGARSRFIPTVVILDRHARA